mmetsp:Transcript_71749/g.181280  ORF Transcript_71749/g.181280 Transcript_71749/m.181280 type:complete len:262 (-) Transcript_71749:237-1022(-)
MDIPYLKSASQGTSASCCPLTALPTMAPAASGMAMPPMWGTLPSDQCLNAAATLGGTMAMQAVVRVRSSLAKAPSSKAPESWGPTLASTAWEPMAPACAVCDSIGASIQAGPMPKKPREAPARAPKEISLGRSPMGDAGDTGCATMAPSASGSGNRCATKAGPEVPGSSTSAGSSSSSSWPSDFCASETKIFDSRHCRKSARATKNSPFARRTCLEASREAKVAVLKAENVPETARTTPACTSMIRDSDSTSSMSVLGSAA